MAERTTEGITGPEAADHVDRKGRYAFAGAVGKSDQHAITAELHYRGVETSFQEPVCCEVRLAGADCDLAFVAIADSDGDVVEHRPNLLCRSLAGIPEHLPPIEIKNGVGATISFAEELMDRRTARLPREP